VSNFIELGTGGLRERNKLKRRDAILDATLAILDVEPAANVTVDQVALIAELSPATVYNLVGGRDEVLRAVAIRIIEQTRDELLASAEAGHRGVDALWMSRLGIDLGSALLVRRSLAHRRLLAYMGSLGAAGLPLHGTDATPLDAADLHINTMRYAQKKGMIRRNLDPVLLGILVANAYNGTLLRWSYDGVDDSHLLPLSRLGLISVAASACTTAYRTGLEREMAALSRQITTGPQ
jgi:AcrR family transcriptional regulator